MKALPALSAALDRAVDDMLDEDELAADGMEEAGDGDPTERPATRAAELAQAEARWAERFERQFPAGPGHLPQAVLRRLAAVKLLPDERQAYQSARARLAEAEAALSEVRAGEAKRQLVEARSLLGTGAIDRNALAALEPKNDLESRHKLQRRALKAAIGSIHRAASITLAPIAGRVVAALEKVVEVEVQADRDRAAKCGLNPPTESSIVSALKAAMVRPAELAIQGAVPLADLEAWIDPAALA